MLSDDSDNLVRIHDDSSMSEGVAESIKDVAKDIRGTTSNTRELIHTLLRTGVIEEIARTILETTVAIRDTANEINDVIKDIKERGTIADTTNAALNTVDIDKTKIDTKKKKNIKRKTGKV